MIYTIIFGGALCGIIAVLSWISATPNKQDSTSRVNEADTDLVAESIADLLRPAVTVVGALLHSMVSLAWNHAVVAKRFISTRISNIFRGVREQNRNKRVTVSPETAVSSMYLRRMLQFKTVLRDENSR